MECVEKVEVKNKINKEVIRGYRTENKKHEIDIILDIINRKIKFYEKQETYQERKIVEKLEKLKYLIRTRWSEYFTHNNKNIEEILYFIDGCYEDVLSHIRANITLYRLINKAWVRRYEEIYDIYQALKETILYEIKESLITKTF